MSPLADVPTDASPSLYIGVMSGTSMDSVDAVLVDFHSEHHYRIIAQHKQDYPTALRERLLRVNASLPLGDYAELDVLTARSFTDAILALLNHAGLPRNKIAAIGCHGQTVFHHPAAPICNSLQIGNPALVAHLTGLPVIADFRRADIAAGGQGAPLVPAFHRQFMSEQTEDRAVLNIGGIANVTLLPSNSRADVTGFDTGPGNCLLDGWIRHHQGLPYDSEGKWARSGKMPRILLERLLTHPFFALEPPKSTGKDEFNLDWLLPLCASFAPSAAPEDIQAALLELTACSIVKAIVRYAPTTRRLFVCGGGVNNTALVDRISEKIAPIITASTQALDIDPQWVEAAAFAWLAKQRLAQCTGNIPTVTGAHRQVILGAIYPA